MEQHNDASCLKKVPKISLTLKSGWKRLMKNTFAALSYELANRWEKKRWAGGELLKRKYRAE